MQRINNSKSTSSTPAINFFYFVCYESSNSRLQDMGVTEDAILYKKDLGHSCYLYHVKASALTPKQIRKLDKLSKQVFTHTIEQENEILFELLLVHLKKILSHTFYFDILDIILNSDKLSLFNIYLSHFDFTNQSHNRDLYEFIIIKKNAKMFKNLLDKKPNIITDFEATTSLLSTAASNGDLEIVKIMLNSKFFNSFSSLTHSLEIAARYNQPEVLKAFLADERMSIHEWHSAILCAIKGHHIELVNTLLKKEGLDLSFDNNAALFAAISENLPSLVIRLLDDIKVNPFVEGNFNSYSAFEWAAYHGRHDIITIFLSDTRITPKDYNKAIVAASNANEVEISKLLFLKGKKHLNLKNFELFINVLKKGFTDIVKFLLEYSEINPADNNNHAICAAAYLGHLPILKLLLKDHRVLINARINDGKDQTPLMQALSNSKIEVLYFFIENKNIDLNLYPELIATICSKTHTFNELELIKYLIKDGRVKPHYNNDEALKMAAKNNKCDILQFLLSNLTFDSLTDTTTALLKACHRGHYQATVLLLKKCEIMGDKIINELPHLVSQSCKTPHDNKFLETLKIILADKRITSVQTLDEWQTWLSQCAFKDKAQVKILEKIIITTLASTVWNKARNFHFFSVPRFFTKRDKLSNLPTEIENIIYCKMINLK